MNRGTCQSCGCKLPQDKRWHAKTCSPRCRQLKYRQIKQQMALQEKLRQLKLAAAKDAELVNHPLAFGMYK